MRYWLFAIVLLCWSLLVYADSIDSYMVETEYQNGKQEIRVLLPDGYRKDSQYRVLYVLPVNKGFTQKFGYGLGTLKEMNAHNRYNLIIVQMGFEREPWFGDHVTDPKVRQASYVKDFVVPFIEKKYAAMKSREGRLLFGFSKSGWGAFSLILKYPEYFGYAAAWDSPLLLKDFHFGMESVYGTSEQLSLYRPDLLIPMQKAFFEKEIRLVLTGENFWGKMIPTSNGGSHTVETHKLLGQQGLKHYYDNTLEFPHRWDKRWMEPTLKALMELTGDSKAEVPESQFIKSKYKSGDISTMYQNEEPDKNSTQIQENSDKAAFDHACKVQWQEVFHDSCTDDWTEKWFLDGRVGAVTTSPKGMQLTAGPQLLNDAHHLVLWTKDSFAGDVKIEYDYTRLDFETGCVNILYIQATGSGKVPFVEDIAEWKEFRQVASMWMYYNHMNTYHISYAALPGTENEYIRARRYIPESTGLEGTGLEPDYYPKGLFEPGVKHRITVIKKDRDLFMRVGSDDQTYYCHFTNMELPIITDGRIGLRHMFTRSARYKNFSVSIPVK
jgi:hypothetical protein